MLIDMHVHTREHSSDAQKSAPLIVQESLAAGLDGIVFTDHDYVWPDEELETVRKTASRSFVVLSGGEITFPKIHFLVFGFPPGPIPSFSDPANLCEFAQRNGICLAVAHPFSTTWRLPAIHLLRPGVEAAECYNARRKSFELRNVQEIRNMSLSELAGSDYHGHSWEVIGQAATFFPGTICTICDLVNAIRHHQTRAIRPDSWNFKHRKK